MDLLNKDINMSNKFNLLPYLKEDLFGLSPNDPQMMGWEIKKFHIDSLWNRTTGNGVKVAVIDTGCDYNHPDIANNILQGRNFVEGNNDPIDRNGHGTHVSSTICAKNNGFGMVGIAPETKIVPIKCLNDNGGGEENHIAAGILWAIDQRVDFITMSIGAQFPSSKIESAIKTAASKGIVMFCAAGNNGSSTDILYPAKYPETISIGAIDKNLNRTHFTCSGESLNFLAPGQDIMGCIPGDRYALMSGTSMSNPYAVGIASLLLSFNRKNNKYKLQTYKDYIAVLKQYSKPLNDSKYRGIKKYEGYGIIYPPI